MNDFDYDVLQKKRLARNAAHKKNGRKSRKVTLPSDYLSNYQKLKLNGAVSVYKIGQRISWDEFRSYPQDVQVEYLQWFVDKFHCTTWGFVKIFNTNLAAVNSYFQDRPDIRAVVHGRMNKMQKEALDTWLSEGRSESPKQEKKPEPVVETKKPEIPYFSHVLKQGEFTMMGTGVEISQTLFGIFRDSKIRVKLSFEAIEEEEPEELENAELSDIPAEC